MSLVFEVPTPRHNHDRPTNKPVALVEAKVKNIPRSEVIVFDPLLGSDSTLIAAEQLDRRCSGLGPHKGEVTGYGRQ